MKDRSKNGIPPRGKETNMEMTEEEFSPASTRMGIWPLSTLEELSRQALLRNEALAISALEKLPKMLVPALFEEAFSNRYTTIVKAMVVAWPFPYLRVKGLMNSFFDSEIFHAVLDGLDVLLTQQVRPTRGELRVLDFRRVPREFRTIQAGAEAGNCSAETVSEKQAGKPPPRRELRPRMKVRVDLYFSSQLREEEKYFLQWAQQRKDSLRLCCENMKITFQSLDNVRTLLSVFELEYIKLLELTTDWSWSTLAQFSTYLTEMRNLHSVSLVHIHENIFGACCLKCLDEKKFVQKLFSQFSGLSSLQHLYLRGFFFFSEHVKLLLRNLKTPLETFSVTDCHMFESYLKDFALCPSLHQLKHLNMSGILLCNVSILPLGVLLEMGADRLETLELQGCRIEDSQFRELLPALSQCSQLTKVNFYNNDFSMNLLSDLLHHTANMSKMTMEQYPAPRECYDEWNCISIDTFSRLCSQLMDTLRAIRQPKRISFATVVCSGQPFIQAKSKQIPHEGHVQSAGSPLQVSLCTAGRQKGFLGGNFISNQEEGSRKDQQEGRNEFLSSWTIQGVPGDLL
ncbi:PRAME family member 12-like [Arvicola amphibius]|uniref:PRAME family member 12-like n=1 Tax=Arvicola amphibius TaxID=1047088 RepID=UPI001C0A5676|nr:PRAME family member 12-like [Arvicola amphibius]